MSKDNKQSFMNNVAIILFAQLAVKVLGLVYRMVITNIDGFADLGNGYYTAGFNVYTLLLALSSVGIPNAIAKMTAERIALGDTKGADRIFKTALVLFSFIGIVCTALMFFGAEWIATTFLKMPGAKYVLMALSPSIVFVCISSVIRGYFNGMKNMKATSTSQILEQIFKCIFTVGICLIISAYMIVPSTDAGADYKAQILAAGGNLATSIATVFSLIYLFVFYKKHKNSISHQVSENSTSVIKGSFLKICKLILLVSIPISLGSIISAINRIVDTGTITRGIEAGFANYIPHGAIFNPTQEQLQREAARLSGMLAKSDTLLNLPIALNIAFATVLVPSISGALAVGNKQEVSDKVSLSFLISMLIILPCAAGYIALAKPIFMLIYPSAPAGYELLMLSSIALIFIALNQTISGSLQGCGKIYAPAIGLLIGCIAKFILNMTLIRIPEINIYGAPLGSIACQLISFTYGFTVLRKAVSVKLELNKYIIKPLISTVAMGVVAYLSYKGIYLLTSSNMISLLTSILVSLILYLFLVLAMKIFKINEIEQLPMGEKLAKAARKLPFYKK